MQQIEALKQIHERHLDQKNAAIDNFAKDVEEAEEQYATAIQAHCINVDTLIDLQTARLQTLQNQFEADLNVLQTEFDNER